MDSIFVLLPDNQFDADYSRHKIVYICEDPVFFNGSGAKLTFLRQTLRAFYMKLRAVHPCVKYVNYADIVARGSVFDYFIGSTRQVFMYRLSCTWSYGDAPWDYTYCGINVRWVEHPGFLLTYRTIRDECSSRHKYLVGPLMNKIVKASSLPVGVLDVECFSGDSAQAIVSKKCTDRYVKAKWNAVGCKIEKNYDLTRYSLGDIGVLLPWLNIGVITPLEIINNAVALNIDIRRLAALVHDLTMRELWRLVYLANSRISQYKWTSGRKRITVEGEPSWHTLGDVEKWIAINTVNGVSGAVLAKKINEIPWCFDWCMYSLIPHYTLTLRDYSLACASGGASWDAKWGTWKAQHHVYVRGARDPKQKDGSSSTPGN